MHARPGLVLGLAPGGSTRGAAYRIDPVNWVDIHSYPREREQPTETYIETRTVVRLADGQRVSVLAYVSDLHHLQWAGDLVLEAQARLIAGATGMSGRNIDYLRDLVAHLRAEGVRDHGMEALLEQVEALEP